MPVKHVKALAELVRKKQPNAMLCSRIGHGMGDYLSLGDMEVPVRSQEGLWETCDSTNDSWSYAWYDQNRKEPKEIIDWMGKFGEWKYLLQVGNWQPGGVVEWDVDVAKAGDYHVALTYKGEGRPVWSVNPSEGVKIQNQQAARHVYKSYRIGIISFSKPGNHKGSVSLVEGDPARSSLEAITFTPAR